MKNTCGVWVSLLAMGIAGLLPAAASAQSRLSAGGAGGGSESSSTTNAAGPSSAPASSSSAELRERIKALQEELAKLNGELAAEENPGAAAPAATAPQDAPPGAQGGAAPAATPPAPMPLPTPSMSGPLATGIPHELPAGPFGKIQVTGILSGMGWTEGDHVLGDMPTHVDVSNAQVFIQKTTGWWQFYLQGGAYNIPVLGVPFARTVDTVTNLYGPFPQGYLKLVKGNFNVEIGALPTLIGAEYTFDFQNMNIERGLLWNQENAVNRGIQLNDTWKKLTLAFTWNDGFYSNKYNWLWGSAAWAFNSANTLSFVGGGNFNGNGRGVGSSALLFPETPGLQNNSMIFNLIYTYTKGPLTISPYYQYNVVRRNATIGITSGSHTQGGAILANYNFKHGISLSARPEYIKSGSSLSDPFITNILGFGPNTGAFSFTVTPTYVKDAFFVRGDFSIVHITNADTTTFPLAFGPDGTKLNQPRGAIEAGFMF